MVRKRAVLGLFPLPLSLSLRFLFGFRLCSGADDGLACHPLYELLYFRERAGLDAGSPAAVLVLLLFFRAFDFQGVLI